MNTSTVAPWCRGVTVGLPAALAARGGRVAPPDDGPLPDDGGARCTRCTTFPFRPVGEDGRSESGQVGRNPARVSFCTRKLASTNTQ